MLFIPPAVIGATGGPVGFVITGVISIVGTLFNIFGGGVSGAVKSALESMRQAIFEVSDRLGRFAWTITHGVGWILRALSTLWVRVLHPILDKVLKITRRLSDFIDKILKPYLDAIAKIRKTILDLYDRFVRPIYDAIQAVRKAVAILKILHVPFADQLDKYLAQLQAMITAPLLELLKRTSDLGRWINVLLTAKMVLQSPVLINSLFAYRGTWTRMFWNAQSQPLTSAELARLAPPDVVVERRQAITNGLQYVKTRGGPYAELVTPAVQAGLRSIRR